MRRHLLWPGTGMQQSFEKGKGWSGPRASKNCKKDQWLKASARKPKATAGDGLQFPKYTKVLFYNRSTFQHRRKRWLCCLSQTWPWPILTYKRPVQKTACWPLKLTGEAFKDVWESVTASKLLGNFGRKMPFFGLKIWQKRVWRKLPELPNRCGHAARAVACRWWRSSRAVIWQIVIVVTRSQQIPQCSESLLRPKIFGCLWLEVPH